MCKIWTCQSIQFHSIFKFDAILNLFINSTECSIKRWQRATLNHLSYGKQASQVSNIQRQSIHQTNTHMDRPNANKPFFNLLLQTFCKSLKIWVKTQIWARFRSFLLENIVFSKIWRFNWHIILKAINKGISN